MANEQNLIKPDDLTPEQRRENASKAGKASVEAKRRRKTLKEELLLLLSEGDTQKSVSVALLQKAMDGDVKAFEVLRDTIGERPADRVQATQTVFDMSKFTTEEIKAMLDDDI